MKYCLGIFVSLFLGTVGAQSIQDMDTITVTSSLIPLKVHETGRHITVYNESHIRSLPVTSIDEVLQTIPGVEVQSRNGFGAQGDIIMRGSTFTQVLVLIDGMKMNDPLTAHFNSNIPVAAEEIRRIEVLRGPAAAMYGPDAVGGVVNIITKAFAPKQDETSSTGVKLGLGSHRQRTLSADARYVGPRLRVAGNFQMNRADGELIPSRTTMDNGVLPAYRNYFDIRTGGISLAHRLKGGSLLSVRSGYDWRDFSARYFYTTSPFDKSVEKVTNWFNVIRLERTGERKSTTYQLAHKHGTDEFIFSPDFASTNHHATDFLNINVSHLQVMSEMVSLKYGVQADNRQIRSNDRGDHQDWHVGGYAMGIYRSGPWNVSGSLRIDYDQNYDVEILPQLNGSFIWGDLVGRASIGRSIRAADYTERYVSNNLMNLTPGRSLGNPYLLAESSWSEELGADYYLLPGWKLQVTGFLRQSDRLIDYVSKPSEEIIGVGDLQEDADYFFAQNISQVKTRGLEIMSEYRKQINDFHIAIVLGYTHVKTTNQAGVISVYLANHARHLLTTSTTLGWKGLQWSISSLYKQRDDRQALAINRTLAPSYHLLNARMGIDLGNGFLGNLQMQNIFDTSYQNILGAAMPGRWLMAGVAYRWNRL